MKVPRWIVPGLVILLTAAGLSAARLFAIPSLALDFSVDEAMGRESTQTAVFLVDGLKCVDTARRAASTLKGLPGVIRYVAYASHNRVEITFDPARINIEALREAIEGPVYDEEAGRVLFHLFKVLEIDRKEVLR